MRSRSVSSGKYVKHRDAYKSVYEVTRPRRNPPQCAGATWSASIQRKLAAEGAAKLLGGVDGLLVPGGFDKRGIEGKIEAIRFARENGLPFFGICLGLQCATIEFARNVVGLADANSTEFNQATPHPVVCLLDAQRKITQIGGTMRLGAFDCRLAPGSRAHAAFRADFISERHRHRYEVNNDYRAKLEAAGMRFSGTSPDGSLVEVIELPDHPVVCRHPEPPGVQVKAHPAAPALPRLHRRQSGAPPGQKGRR